MPRLVIVIPFFCRHELTSTVFRHYRQVQQQSRRGHVELLAVGSEGSASRRLAEAEGLDHAECANLPLDAKYEHGFLAAREYRPDAVSLVGSNDIIGVEYFARAMDAIVSGRADATGLLDCYLVDLCGGRLLYWLGYPQRSRGNYRGGSRSRHGESIGAGRVIGRGILDAIGWRPFPVNASAPSGTLNHDGRNTDCLNRHGARIVNWSMADAGCRYWNVKSSNDLNPIGAFERAYGDELNDAGHLINGVPRAVHGAWRQRPKPPRFTDP